MPPYRRTPPTPAAPQPVPRQQTTAKPHDAGLKARIPWHSSVPRCARHGKLNTSGFTDKLKVTNKCRGKIGYKAYLKRGRDSVCHMVKKHKSQNFTWNWPAAIDKIKRCYRPGDPVTRS
ncbi:hypothetical protein DMH15_32400 [Streptomyces sp. WAC 06725]|nr:hypothetical protein DMH15_32400 [Streptomyces sp. WAC 06725]